MVIRRSTVAQTDDEGEEVGKIWYFLRAYTLFSASYSDSDLPKKDYSLNTLSRAGSQENLLSNRASHTNAKYRRKHGECWRKADLAKEETDDEAEIEVDVKQEECLSDSGGHIVKKVCFAT